MDKKNFDEILKQNVINATGVDLFGYGINDRNYPNYYSACAFADFINQMTNHYPEHYKSYSEGEGNELIPKKGRYGLLPPKMASVASSSRFCYLALRNGAVALGGSGDVEFEHACHISEIKGGTPPQMDAYIKNENIFVEAKCHEIFDSHKVILKSKYFDLLFGQDNDFGFASRQKSDDRCFEISLLEFGIDKKTTRFDIKQLICHLLGIKSHNSQKEPATLVYLFFKPKASTESQQKEIDEVFDDLTNEIKTIFGSESSPIKKFAEKNKITLKAVAQYAEIMSPLIIENTIRLYPNI